MVGELIRLPLRIGASATRLWLRAAEETLTVAVNAAGQVIDAASGRRSVTGAARPLPPEARGGAIDARARDIDWPRVPGPAAQTATVEEPPEPSHVSEEPVLVEEFAEPGAEDGAGAELHVAQPWSGYDQMNARQVIARLAQATTAELAGVQLYEHGHRGRQTILTAAERELQRANGRGPQS